MNVIIRGAKHNTIRYEHRTRKPLKVYIDERLNRSQIRVGEIVNFRNTDYKVVGAGYSPINQDITYLNLKELDNMEE